MSWHNWKFVDARHTSQGREHHATNPSLYSYPYGRRNGSFDAGGCPNTVIWVWLSLRRLYLCGLPWTPEHRNDARLEYHGSHNTDQIGFSFDNVGTSLVVHVYSWHYCGNCVAELTLSWKLRSWADIMVAIAWWPDVIVEIAKLKMIEALAYGVARHNRPMTSQRYVGEIYRSLVVPFVRLPSVGRFQQGNAQGYWSPHSPDLFP